MSYTPFFLILIQKSLFLILAILGLGLLVTLHELGHFLFCKLFGVATPSFSLGFGPKLWSKKWWDTEFIIAAIPLGGYVEIAGNEEVGQGEQLQAKRDDEFSFQRKNYVQKLLIMSGGILANFAFAYTVMVILFSLGIPQTQFLYPRGTTATITAIVKDSPADKAHLLPGDTITMFDGQAITGGQPPIYELVKNKANKVIDLVIQRNNVTFATSANLTPSPRNPAHGFLGASFAWTAIKPQGFAGAIREGIATTNQFITMTIGAFVSLAKNRSAQEVGGPVAILGAIAGSVSQGLRVFLVLLALISVNLAVLNLIPLPILDGGQILFLTIEAIIRRELPERIRTVIHYVCWALMIALLVYLTYHDIIRIIASFFA